MFVYFMAIETPESQTKFEQIYRTYKGLMFYVANQILHNDDDAEDAVHLAFIKIAENIEKILEPVCPKTKSFVVTIVENKAIDIYRKKHRKEIVEFNEETVGLTAEYTGSNRLTQCILKLPANYREVIVLKYYQGYSIKEIASMLDISIANATKLDQRAKKKLEVLCKEEGLL